MKSNRSWATVRWIALLITIAWLIFIVFEGWRASKVIRTGYGYYYHGGFSGLQQDVCFERWQFGTVTFLIWFIGFISFNMAKGTSVYSEFVVELAAAIIAALPRRRVHRG